MLPPPTTEAPGARGQSPEEFRMRERSHMIDVPTCTLVDFKN